MSASKIDTKKKGNVANLTNAGRGRPKGSLNKATAELKALAGQYTEQAVRELARLAVEAESESARVSAIRELLDRAHGKPAQSVDVTGDMSFRGLEVVIRKEA